MRRASCLDKQNLAFHASINLDVQAHRTLHGPTILCQMTRQTVPVCWNSIKYKREKLWRQIIKAKYIAWNVKLESEDFTAVEMENM
jgi:hypothetical protein